MIVLYVTILLASFFLSVWGDLPKLLLIPLFLLGVVGLAYHVFLDLQLKLKNRKDLQTYKVKWVGEFRDAYSYKTIADRHFSLMITRQDDLLILTEEKELKLALKEVAAAVVVRGHILLSLSDETIFRYLDLPVHPAVLRPVRMALSNDPNLRRRNFLLISRKDCPPFSGLLGPNSNPFVFVALDNRENAVKDFCKRPEIRAKAKIISKKTAKYLAGLEQNKTR